LIIDGERIHIFECFALVNFLLCSAVASAAPTGRLAGKPGRATRIMQTNCAFHFCKALEVLEPTVIVAQGHGVRTWIARAYGLPAQRPPDGIEEVPVGGTQRKLVSFAHPAAYGTLNWVMNKTMPYLLNTVAPTIARVFGHTSKG
jgi:hypothetical protein